MNFSFNSRETYLQYRAEWKARYAKATQDVRTSKEEVREASRNFMKNYQTYSYLVHAVGSPEFKAFYSTWDALSRAESNRASCRNEARELIEELVEAKKESCRQFNLTRT